MPLRSLCYASPVQTGRKKRTPKLGTEQESSADYPRTADVKELGALVDLIVAEVNDLRAPSSTPARSSRPSARIPRSTSNGCEIAPIGHRIADCCAGRKA